MEFKEYLQALKAQKLNIISLALAGLVLAGIISLVQPLKYRSSLNLLVVQQANSADAYTVMRSTEYLGKVLSQVAYSSSFAKQVLAQTSTIDQTYFGNTVKTLSKRWKNTIEVKSTPETGVLEISVYHTKRDQAELIARNLGAFLITNNSDYHGMKGAVSLKVLDEPITINYPVRPNLPVNMALGLLTGILFALCLVYFKNTAPEVAVYSMEPEEIQPKADIKSEPIIETKQELEASVFAKIAVNEEPQEGFYEPEYEGAEIFYNPEDMNGSIDRLLKP